MTEKTTGIKFTLGWELESTTELEYFEIPPEVEKGSDGSVNGDAIEYRLYPDFVADLETSLKCLRKLVQNPSLAVDRSCGFHVHVGLMFPPYFPHAKKTSELWGAWLVQLAEQIETSAFKAVPSSRLNNDYCRSWKNQVPAEGIIKLPYSPSKCGNKLRYQWLNVTEIFRSGGIGTAEFRLMGDTKRYGHLAAWISACLLMGRAALELIEDPSTLDSKVYALNTLFQNVEWIKKSKKAVVEIRNLLRAANLLTLPTYPGPLDRINYQEGLIKSIMDDENYCRSFYHDGKRKKLPVSGCRCAECKRARVLRNEARQKREALRLWNTPLTRPVPQTQTEWSTTTVPARLAF